MLTAGQWDPCMYSSPTTEKASLWLAVSGHVDDPGCISTLPNHIEGTSLKVSMTSEILPWIRRWSYIQSYFPTSRSTHALGHKSLPWLVVIDWNVYTLISRLNIYNTTLCATGIPPPRYFRTILAVLIQTQHFYRIFECASIPNRQAWICDLRHRFSQRHVLLQTRQLLNSSWCTNTVMATWHLT